MCRSRRRDALSYALKLLRTDWTRDHLMGTSPATDAAILSSPLQQLHSLAFEGSCQFDPLDITITNYSVMMNAESVLIPAFSKDGLNAGYVVEDSYGLYPNEIILCQNGKATLRFLASEEDGTFVGVLRQPSADIIVHLRISHRSGSFTCFGFPTNSLKQIVDNDIDNVDVMERMLHSACTTETRKKCPLCTADSTVSCACLPQFHRAKTPLDLRSFALNMIQTQLGQVSGTGLYEEFANGGSNQIIPLGSQRRCFRVAKQGSMERLIKWAVGDVLKHAPTGIQRVLSSPLEPQTTLTSFNSTLLQPELNLLQDPFSGPPLLLDNVEEPVTSSEISPESVHFEDPHTFPDLFVPPAIPLKKQRTAHNKSAAQATDPLWPFDFNLSPVVSTEDCGVSIPQHTAEQVLQFPTQVPPVVLPAPIMPQMTKIAPAPTVKIAPAPMPLVSSAMTPIAPRRRKTTLPLPPNLVEFSEEKMQKTAEDLRAYKAYQRKIRNRESAARSNLARKQRRLELARRKAQSAST